MLRVARAVRTLPIVAVLAMSALVGLVPAVAPAQTGPQSATPPADTTAPAAPATPPAGSDAPAKPVVPATGYGWSTKPAGRPRIRVRATRASAAGTANPANASGTIIPGFETMADGSSRLFVQMQKPAQYTTKVAKGAITYILKGLHIDRRNNLNALVTVHFNTPVTSARLVPHGGDLWFVVDLRESVQPTVSMDATKDGGAMLRIEFPKGDYLAGAPSPAAPTPPTAPASPTAAAPAPAPATSAAPAPSSSAYHPDAL
jgi:hypothetical protein